MENVSVHLTVPPSSVHSSSRLKTESVKIRQQRSISGAAAEAAAAEAASQAAAEAVGATTRKRPPLQLSRALVKKLNWLVMTVAGGIIVWFIIHGSFAMYACDGEDQGNALPR